MERAGITDPADVHYVQTKTPLLTIHTIRDAKSRGKTVWTEQTHQSMDLSNGCTALGVAVALGEIEMPTDADVMHDRSLYSAVASCSSGVELDQAQVVVVGNAARRRRPLPDRPLGDEGRARRRTASGPRSGTPASTCPSGRTATDLDGRLVNVFLKCEASQDGTVRGRRNAMLDDSDVHWHRQIKSCVGGVTAAVTGDPAVFVSVSAAHQGPDGGGPVAAIVDLGAASRPATAHRPALTRRGPRPRRTSRTRRPHAAAACPDASRRGAVETADCAHADALALHPPRRARRGARAGGRVDAHRPPVAPPEASSTSRSTSPPPCSRSSSGCSMGLRLDGPRRPPAGTFLLDNAAARPRARSCSACCSRPLYSQIDVVLPYLGVLVDRARPTGAAPAPGAGAHPGHRRRPGRGRATRRRAGTRGLARTDAARRHAGPRSAWVATGQSLPARLVPADGARRPGPRDRAPAGRAATGGRTLVAGCAVRAERRRPTGSAAAHRDGVGCVLRHAPPRSSARTFLAAAAVVLSSLRARGPAATGRGRRGARTVAVDRPTRPDRLHACRSCGWHR